MANPISILLAQLAAGASAPSEAENTAAVEKEMAVLVEDDGLLTQKEYDFTTGFLAQYWQSGALKGLNNFLKTAADNPNWSISPAALETLSKLGPKGVDQVPVQALLAREKEAVRVYQKLMAMVGKDDPLTVDEWNDFTPDLSAHYRDGGVDGLRFFLREVNDSEGRLRLERGVKKTFETAAWAKKVIHRSLLNSIRTVKPPPAEPKKVEEFGTVRITVQDDLGEKLQGVRIEIASAGNPIELYGQPSETSKRGLITLQEIPVGRVEVMGERNGYESHSITTEIRNNRRTIVVLTLPWIPKERITEKMALSWLPAGLTLNPAEQELLKALNDSVDRHGLFNWDRFSRDHLSKYLDKDLKAKKEAFGPDGVRRSFLRNMAFALKSALLDKSMTVRRDRVTTAELTRIVDNMDAEDREAMFPSRPLDLPGAAKAAELAAVPAAAVVVTPTEVNANLEAVYAMLRAIQAGDVSITSSKLAAFKKGYAWLQEKTKKGTGYSDFLTSISNPIVFGLSTTLTLDGKDYTFSHAQLIFAADGGLNEIVATIILDDFKKYEAKFKTPTGGSETDRDLFILTYFSSLLNYLDGLMGRVKEEERREVLYLKMKAYRDTLAAKVQTLYDKVKEAEPLLLTGSESANESLNLLLEIGATRIIDEGDPNLKKAFADGIVTRKSEARVEAIVKREDLLSFTKARIRFARTTARPALARSAIPQPFYNDVVQEIFGTVSYNRVLFGTVELEALMDLAKRGVAFLKGELARVSENEKTILARQEELRKLMSQGTVPDAEAIAEENDFLTSWLSSVREQKQYFANQLAKAEKAAPQITPNQLLMAARLIAKGSNVTVTEEVQRRLVDR